MIMIIEEIKIEVRKKNTDEPFTSFSFGDAITDLGNQWLPIDFLNGNLSNQSESIQKLDSFRSKQTEYLSSDCSAFLSFQPV